MALAPMVCAFFLAWRLSQGELGFPLDDAWIHQTYARNLARYGQWAYVPGHLSAGSTSPLWTLLIAPCYLLGIDFKAWTFALGMLFFTGTVWAAWRLSLVLSEGNYGVALAAAFFCALEWHLGWAALSGMETIPFTFLSLLLLIEHTSARGFLPAFTPVPQGLGMGILAGLLCLTRPEGLLLVGLIILDAIIKCASLKARKTSPHPPKRKLTSLLWLSVGLTLCLGGYVAFNLKASGHPFPNTFYAKAAEYRELVERWPLWVRLGRVTLPTLVGAQALLVPGFVMAAFKEIRKALGERFRKGVPVPLLWWGMLLLAYAIRLPVAYQHGRYTMPVIPIFVVYGFAGMSQWLERGIRKRQGQPAKTEPVLQRVLLKVWAISTLILLLAFTLIGARAYSTDVGIIQCEMVQTAFWLRENTPPDALIAVHDIGAIGYYAQRPLLDLAGLVTPEVIPFIRDEGRLREFILAKGAQYLVTFPSWYPHLVDDPIFMPLYSTGCDLTIRAGGDNMAVYKVRGV